jgi:hypothetical protein
MLIIIILIFISGYLIPKPQDFQLLIQDSFLYYWDLNTFHSSNSITWKPGREEVRPQFLSCPNDWAALSTPEEPPSHSAAISWLIHEEQVSFKLST